MKIHNHSLQPQHAQVQFEAQSFGAEVGETRKSFFGTSLRVTAVMISALALSGKAERSVEAREQITEPIVRLTHSCNLETKPSFKELARPHTIEHLRIEVSKPAEQGSSGSVLENILHNQETAWDRVSRYIRKLLRMDRPVARGPKDIKRETIDFFLRRKTWF